MGFAVVAFVFYVIKYFITANDKRSEAGQYIMYSMIGFFVILSMWGIVNILVNTFELDSNSPSSWSDIKQLFPTGTSGSTSGSVKAETSAFNQGPSTVSSANSGTNNSTSVNFSVPNTGSNTNAVNSASGGAPASQVSGNTSDNSTQYVPFDEEQQSIQKTNLTQYNQNMENGVYTGNKDLIKARVIDLATKNGVVVGQNSNIQYVTGGGVPVSITVDGKNVPLDKSNYTQAELKSRVTAESVKSSMGQ
jgi:hypothetical protein